MMKIIKDYLFSPLLRMLELLLFDGGMGMLLKSQWGVLGLCVLCGAGLQVPAG
jgi:hypothetical protein